MTDFGTLGSMLLWIQDTKVLYPLGQLQLFIDSIEATEMKVALIVLIFFILICFLMFFRPFVCFFYTIESMFIIWFWVCAIFG